MFACECNITAANIQKIFEINSKNSNFFLLLPFFFPPCKVCILFVLPLYTLCLSIVYTLSFHCIHFVFLVYTHCPPTVYTLYTQ